MMTFSLWNPVGAFHSSYYLDCFQCLPLPHYESSTLSFTWPPHPEYPTSSPSTLLLHDRRASWILAVVGLFSALPVSRGHQWCHRVWYSSNRSVLFFASVIAVVETGLLDCRTSCISKFHWVNRSYLLFCVSNLSRPCYSKLYHYCLLITSPGIVLGALGQDTNVFCYNCPSGPRSQVTLSRKPFLN